jgi:hypothetical protein
MAAYVNSQSTVDASAKYFWTVDVWEEIYEGTGLFNWVKIENFPKGVYKNYRTRWVVRVWEKQQGANSLLSPTNPGNAKALGGGDGVQVSIWGSWKTSMADKISVGSVQQESAYGVVNTLSYMVDSYPEGWRTPKIASVFPYTQDEAKNTGEGSTKELFYFDIDAKVDNVAVSPRIIVTVDDKEVMPYGMTIPDITFTKAKKNPSVPASVKKAAYADWLITLDQCVKPNRWVAVVPSIKQPNADGTMGNTGEINPDLLHWYLNFWKLDGSGTPETQYIGYDYKASTNKKVPAIYGADKEDSFKKACKLFFEYKTNTCGTPQDNGDTEAPPSASSKPIDIDLANRTNPPNHYVTRDVSYFNKVKENIQKDLGKPRASSEFIIAYDKIDLLNSEVTKAGRLGMIFQDKASATALNGAGNADKPWGFRFAYNPTSISYTTAMDTSIDWMLADKDPANYIGGNVSVGFTLYLNRMPDMTELAGKKGKTGTYGKNYPRELREEEIQGILNRGTEYDLEFLYRVLNGEPKPSDNTLLTYNVAGKPAVTSDFGYITGTPVWLKIHNNLRYKGSVASLSVNHVIFNELMVPMFSTVDVTMIRYPVISETSDEVQKAFSDKQTKYVAGINKTAGD